MLKRFFVEFARQLFSMVCDHRGKMSSNRVLQLAYGIVFLSVFRYTTINGIQVQSEIIWYVSAVTITGFAAAHMNKRLRAPKYPAAQEDEDEQDGNR